MSTVVINSSLSTQVSRSLKMEARAIKALNTTAGLSDYVVATIGRPQELGLIQKALEECGLQPELGFVQKKASKQGKYTHIEYLHLLVHNHIAFPSYKCRLLNSTKVSRRGCAGSLWNNLSGEKDQPLHFQGRSSSL